MTSHPDLQDTILAAWRTNDRITRRFVQQLSTTVWDAEVPFVGRRTVRTIAAHMHNARSRWIKTLGAAHGIVRPPLVDQRRVSRPELVSALEASGAGMEALLVLGLEHGGAIPPSKAYVWRNLALDVGHVLTYFVAHEAHHRGQILLIARQIGRPLPDPVVNALWWWKPQPPTRPGRKRPS